MSLAHLTRAARAYMRAELLVSRIRLKVEAQRLLLVAFAAILALMALGFANIALYAALLSIWGPVWTPLSLAGLDLALALIVLAAALTRKPGPELEMAEELKAMSGAALEEQLQQGVPGMNLLGSLVPGESSTLKLIVPLAAALAGSLAKRRAAKRPSE